MDMRSLCRPTIGAVSITLYFTMMMMIMMIILFTVRQCLDPDIVSIDITAQGSK